MGIPGRVLADEGFGAGYELEELSEKGVAAFIPMGKVSGENPVPCPLREKPFPGELG